MGGRLLQEQQLTKQGRRLWCYTWGSVLGFSHLRLCPKALGPGLKSWLCGDVKATCLIQGSFFSELWTG